MATKRGPDGHNVRVTRVAPPHRSSRRAHRILAVTLLVLALVVSACGGDAKKKTAAEPKVDLPTGNVQVPSGVTLTKAGTQLAFHQPGTVAYEPNTQRSSVLQIIVDSVQAGKISDFAAYQLDARTKSSRPYYVKVRVKNLGDGDLSRSPVPLYADDSRNTLIQSSSFNNDFKRCPSTPLPAGFTAGKSASLCLVYLVPPGGTLREMSFRPLQNFEPITWKGAILPATPAKKPAKKQKKKG